MASDPSNVSAFTLTAKRPSTFQTTAGPFIYNRSQDKYFNDRAGLAYDPRANRYVDKSGRMVVNPRLTTIPPVSIASRSGFLTPPSSISSPSHGSLTSEPSISSASGRPQPIVQLPPTATRPSHGALTRGPSISSSSGRPQSTVQPPPAATRPGHGTLSRTPTLSNPSGRPRLNIQPPPSFGPSDHLTDLRRRATVASLALGNKLERSPIQFGPTAPSKLSQLVTDGDTPMSATDPEPNPHGARSFAHEHYVQLKKADFKAGMIFMAPIHTEDWHANAQPNSYTTISQTYGPIYTKCRMMIVVAKYENHYVSLPIYTHGGHGIERKPAKWEYVSIRDSRQPRPYLDPGPNPPITELNMLTASLVLAPSAFVHLPYVVSRVYELHIRPQGELGPKALVQLIALHNRFMPDAMAPLPGQPNIGAKGHRPTSLEEAVQEAEAASVQANPTHRRRLGRAPRIDRQHGRVEKRQRQTHGRDQSRPDRVRSARARAPGVLQMGPRSQA